MYTEDPDEIRRRKPKTSQRIIALVIVFAMIFTALIAAVSVAVSGGQTI